MSKSRCTTSLPSPFLPYTLVTQCVSLTRITTSGNLLSSRVACRPFAHTWSPWQMEVPSGEPAVIFDQPERTFVSKTSPVMNHQYPHRSLQHHAQHLTWQLWTDRAGLWCTCQYTTVEVSNSRSPSPQILKTCQAPWQIGLIDWTKKRNVFMLLFWLLNLVQGHLLYVIFMFHNIFVSLFFSLFLWVHSSLEKERDVKVDMRSCWCAHAHRNRVCELTRSNKSCCVSSVCIVLNLTHPDSLLQQLVSISQTALSLFTYAHMKFLSFLTKRLKGAVSRNSAKLGNYKMPVKLRET